MKEQEVLTELLCSLSEWGLGRTTGHSNATNHDRLRNKIIEDILAMLNEALDQPDGFQDLIEVEFPDTLEEAYEHVLHHDDVDPDTPLFLSHDSVETGYAPFFRCYDRNSPRELIGYRRKPQFRSFQLVQLDPLNRFRFESVSKAELFFHRWFVSGNASRLGVFMEAAIACHAIHKEACFNCKSPNAAMEGRTWQCLARFGMYRVPSHI